MNSKHCIRYTCFKHTKGIFGCNGLFCFSSISNANVISGSDFEEILVALQKFWNGEGQIFGSSHLLPGPAVELLLFDDILQYFTAAIVSWSLPCQCDRVCCHL